MTLFTQIISILACGVLWHLGGQGHKWCRGIAVPSLIAAIQGLKTDSLWSLLYAPALWLMLTLFSYGLTAPPHKFINWLFGGGGEHGDDYEIEFATRFLCGWFWALPAAIFVYTGGAWSVYLSYLMVCPVLIGFFGTRKSVTVSEIGCGMVVALAVFI